MPNTKAKKKTYSGRDWDGSFRSVAHRLSNAAMELPVEEVLPDGSSKATTAGDAFVDVCFEPVQSDAPPDTSRPPRTLREVDEFSDLLKLTVRAISGDRVFKGDPFPMEVLAAMLRLHMAGAAPGEAAWFYYDSDSCMTDPQESYEFFVVANDKIILERVSFSDYHRSGFDPALFVAEDEPDPSAPSHWRNHEEWAQARSRFWYREFFQKTRTGQIMALRADRPDLLIYAQPEAAAVARVERQEYTARSLAYLRRIQTVLWVLVALAILALIWR